MTTKMIIDTCYESVIATLTSQGKIKDISAKLLSLTTNDDRVLYVYEILEELNAFPGITEVNKSIDLSVQYRNQGNQCFKVNGNYKALQYYNLALLHAPLNTDDYSLAISNRSAVLFEMKKYNECLVDIDTVLTLNYPLNLKDKLTKRKDMCKVKLNKESPITDAMKSLCKLKLNNKSLITDESQVCEKINEIMKMKTATDAKYLCASKKLEVAFNEEMGRHVIAKEDINVGDILAIEDPYFVLLLKTQILLCCSYCLSRNFNLLPCSSCCYALYCSESCKQNAWKDYHQVECSLVPTLMAMQFTKLELLGLRTTIKARNDHSDWCDLFKTIEAAEARRGTEYHGLVEINNEWVYDSKYYTSIHMLESNIKKRSVSDIFQKAVTAVVFLKLLTDKTDFLNVDDKIEREKVRRLVAGMLLLHIMTTPTNMHGISANMKSAEGNFVEDVNIGSAAYAFHSLLNHSCAPNVVRSSKLGTGTMKLIALRPIKRGMQIYDNYGSHHALQGLKERQSALKFQYKFTCLCEACVNNWPTYMDLSMCSLSNLPPVPGKLRKRRYEILSENVIECLQKGNRSTALYIYNDLCKLCEQLEPYTPCQELSDCQESLKQCYAIFEGLVPLTESQVVRWLVDI